VSASTSTTLSLAAATELAAGALVRANTSAENAAATARALVAAEADGQAGHGLSRVPSYAAQAKAGKVDGHAIPSAELSRPGVVLVDAQHGFAYPAIDLALDILGPMADRQGVAVAGIRNSHHCGAAGLVVERLAEQGMVALLFANTPQAIAPWGGRRGLFGTNPIAFAAPLLDGPPIVVDLSLSKVARGRILAAKQRGETIPEGWALDAEGRPTTDPAAALAGTMLPLGDAKGTALALMVEILAAGLTGATFAAEASSFLDDKGGPPGTGQLVVALAVGAFGGLQAVAHIGELAEAIEAEPGARLPGRRRMQLREAAIAGGLTLPTALVEQIQAI
jgi:(2R)-3-sulfolactate dehydrogenase (NADP+)